MRSKLATIDQSILVAVDLQPTFMKAIPNHEEILKRGLFLTDVAKILEVPILSAEQYPERMGGIDERLRKKLGGLTPYSKYHFGCCSDKRFLKDLKELNRTQVILWGIETHICICQTALALLQQNFEVQIVSDGVSSRSSESHLTGLRRMELAGAQITHSESVVYEWLGSCKHPKFKEVLNLVKNSN